MKMTSAANHQMSIRGIDGPTKAALASRAKKQGISENKLVVRVLAEAMGTTSVPSSGLARLAGMLNERSQSIEETAQELRAIDKRQKHGFIE